jgi:hypothetical protein
MMEPQTCQLGASPISIIPQHLLSMPCLFVRTNKQYKMFHVKHFVRTTSKAAPQGQNLAGKSARATRSTATAQLQPLVLPHSPHR